MAKPLLFLLTMSFCVLAQDLEDNPLPKNFLYQGSGVANGTIAHSQFEDGTSVTFYADRGDSFNYLYRNTNKELVEQVLLPNPVAEVATVFYEGIVHLFLVDAEGKVFFSFQGAKNAHNKWKQWRDLPGEGTSKISANVTSDGRLRVFGIRKDQAVYSTQKEKNGKDWDDWKEIGTEKVVEVRSQLDAKVVSHLFARTKKESKLVFSVLSEKGWSEWKTLDGLQGIRRFDVTVTDKDVRMEIVALGEKGTIHRLFETKPASGQWSAWNRVGKYEGIRQFFLARTDEKNILIVLAGEEGFFVEQSFDKDGKETLTQTRHYPQKQKKGESGSVPTQIKISP